MTKKGCLVISETIFCDVEQDSDALDNYFERLKICLLSISNVAIEGFSFKHILYVSSDKKKYLKKIKKIISDNDMNFVQLVEYQHPSEGYPSIKGSHIDLIKNPNRTSGLRDKLFEKAAVQHSQYNCFIRIAIDDDDAWLSSHLKNIINLAEYLRFIAGDDSLFGGGIFSTYLAKVDSQTGKVLLENVELDRAVCGNKFYFSNSFEKVSKWSPWSIPDVIDENSINKFKKNYNIDLFGLKGVNPGFVYFRRGQNLSGQNKSWCTTNVLQSYELPSEKEVIKIDGKVSGSQKAEVLGHSQWHNFHKYDYSNYAIYYSAPICSDSSCKTLVFAFYLYKNGKLITKKGYSKKQKGVFSVTHDTAVYEIVCFVKNKEMLPIRIKSSKIYVR